MKRRTGIKLYKPRKTYKHRQIRREPRKPYIKKIKYILEAAKNKTTEVFLGSS